MKSSVLSWLLAHLVYFLASTISQHGTAERNSTGKIIKAAPTPMNVRHALQFHKIEEKKKAVANNHDSKRSAKSYILCAYSLNQVTQLSVSKCCCVVWVQGAGAFVDVLFPLFLLLFFLYNYIKSPGHRHQVMEHCEIVDDGRGCKQQACLFGNISRGRPLLIMSPG